MRDKFLASLLLQLKSLINKLNFQTKVPSQTLIDFNLKDVCEYIMSKQMAQPQFFLKYVKRLIRYLWYYVDQNDPCTIVLYETITYNIQKNPSSYKKKQYELSIVRYVLLINYEIYKLLKKSQVILLNIDKNNDDQLMLKILDPYSARARTIVNLLNQVIDKDNFKIIMEYFTGNFIDSAQSGNLKLQAAFFICLYEIIKMQRRNVVQNLIVFFQRVISQNSILNYCALHTLSFCLKILDFSKSKQNYYGQFIRVIRLGLQSDNEALVYQAMQCFKLFVNKFGIKQQLRDNVDYIQERVFFFIVNSNFNLLQNSSMDCLTELSGIFLQSNIQKVINCLEFCYAVIIQKIETKNYFILNKAVKCMCQIISDIRYYQKIQQHIDCALYTLHQFQNNIQTETLLMSWNFLCTAKIKFQKCSYIFSKIFYIANQYCKKSQLSKRSLGYLVFKQTSICFEIKFVDYFIPTLKTIKNCLKLAVKRMEVDQVKQICSALDAIISKQRPKPKYFQITHQNNSNKIEVNNKDQQKFLSKISSQIFEIIQYFYQIFLQACSIQIKQLLLLSFKVIIEHYGDKLPKAYEDKFIYYFILTVNAFNLQRDMKLQFKDFMLQIENNQNQEPKIFPDENTLNRCRDTLPLILESMKKYIPTLKMKPLIQMAKQQIQQHKSDLDLNFVRYLTCYVQCLTPQQIYQKDTYSHVINTLSALSINKYPRVRTKVTYAVIIIVYKISFSEFQIKINDLLKILNQCKNVKKNSSDYEKDFGACQDNIMCAFGHIFYKFRDHFHKMTYEAHFVHNLFYTWLNGLPLKYDKFQQKQQIYFLSEIVISKLNILIKSISLCQKCKTKTSNSFKKIVSKILQIFLVAKYRIEKERRSRDNKNTLQRVMIAMEKILNYPIFIKNVDQIKNMMQQRYRENLMKLMKKEY